jgi:hypothetical protein
MVYQSNTWYLVRILFPQGSYYSWEDTKGPVRKVFQSTANVVVDTPTSFCCHMLLMMLFHPCVVDDVVPASCC